MRPFVRLPGLIDPHVHFRARARVQRDWNTGSGKARWRVGSRRSSTNHVVPPTSNPDCPAIRIERAEGKAYCDYGSSQ